MQGSSLIERAVTKRRAPWRTAVVVAHYNRDNGSTVRILDPHVPARKERSSHLSSATSATYDRGTAHGVSVPRLRFGADDEEASEWVAYAAVAGKAGKATFESYGSGT